MKKHILLFLICFTACMSQAQVWEGAQILGSQLGFAYTNGLVIDKNQTVYTLLSTNGDLTDGERSYHRAKGGYLLFTCYDSSGTIVWEKQWYSTNKVMATSLKESKDGFLYATGFYTDSLILGNNTLKSQGGMDLFLFKATKQGELLWAKSFGGLENQNVADMKLDKEDNILLTGFYDNDWNILGRSLLNNGFANVYALKLNKDATQCIWDYHTIGSKKTFVDWHIAHCPKVETDPYQNVYLTFMKDLLAIFYIIEKGDTLKNDGILLKLDGSTGKLNWKKNIRTHAANTLHIASNSAGHLFMAASFYDTVQLGNQSTVYKSQGLNLFLSKIDTLGKVMWTKIGPANTNGGNQFRSLTSNGLNVYATGYAPSLLKFNDQWISARSDGTSFIIELDSAATLLKNNAFRTGINAFTTQLAINPSGHTIVTGGTYNTFELAQQYVIGRGGDNPASFLLKCDTTLSVGWNRSLGSGGKTDGYDIILGKHNSSYSVGYFTGVVLFGKDTLKSKGGTEGYILKNGSHNHPVWAKQISGMLDEYVYRIAMDGHENLYVLGSTNSLMARLNTNSIPNTSYNGFISTYMLYLAKLDSNGVTKWIMPVPNSEGGMTSNPNLDLKVSEDGNQIFVAYFSQKMILARFNGSGQWLGATSSLSNQAYISEIGLYNNKLYFLGTFTSTLSFGNQSLVSDDELEDIVIGEMNLDGSLAWMKKTGGAGQQFSSALVVSSQGIYAVGYYYYNGTFGDFDFTGTRHAILKIDFNGAIIKAISPTSASNPGQSIAKSISTDNNFIYVTGNYDGTIQFDNQSITAEKTTDTYLATFTTDLVARKVYTISSDGYEMPRALSSNQHYTVITGYLQENAIFGKIPVNEIGYTTEDVTLGRVNTYVGRINAECCDLPLSTKNKLDKHLIRLWPNPSREGFLLQLEGIFNYEMTVYDQLGHSMEHLTGIGQEIKFGNSLAPGSYLLQIETNDQIYQTKLLKLR